MRYLIGRKMSAVIAMAIAVVAGPGMGHRSASAQEAAKPEPEAKDGVFPLMAWDYAGDEPALKAMGEAGINAVAFVRPTMLDACSRAGLKAIVFDESIAGELWNMPYDADHAIRGLEALVPKWNDHPAVWGYHLKDEPPASDFPALARAAAAVKRLAPGKWPYINLVPGEGKGYDDYVNAFIKTVGPPIVSYDRYVTFEDGGFAPIFWTNLAQVRTLSRARDLPFHNIVLTAAHWHYREVTEADLRLQVFGSLAYGVRGLGYYKFQSRSLPILKAPDLGNFRGAPLDPFGDKTPLWHAMRRVNRVVANLAPTLLKLRSDDVYHIGGALPDLNHAATDKTLVKGLANTAAEVVVGDFTHDDGSRWVLIVNRSLTASTFCNPVFNVEPKELDFVSPVTGSLESYPRPFYALAPGQGVLIRLKP